MCKYVHVKICFSAKCVSTPSHCIGCEILKDFQQNNWDGTSLIWSTFEPFSMCRFCSFSKELCQRSHDLHWDVVLGKAKKTQKTSHLSALNDPTTLIFGIICPIRVQRYIFNVFIATKVNKKIAFLQLNWVSLQSIQHRQPCHLSLPVVSTAGWQQRGSLWGGGWVRWRGTWTSATQWTSWSYMGWWTKRRRFLGAWFWRMKDFRFQVGFYKSMRWINHTWEGPV